MKIPKAKQLPSGNWNVVFRMGDRRVSVTEETESLAVTKALALREELIQAEADEESRRKGNLTLYDAIGDFIKNRENILSPSTINGYYEIRRNRFQHLMTKKVSKIELPDIQAAINEDAKTVSAKTIKNALGLVSAVLREYKDLDFKRLRIPQRKKKEHTYMDIEDMINFFDAIRGCSAEIPLLLAVWLGMRRSEIMGLCWDCVDFERSQIHVRRTYVKNKDGEGYVLRDETKTEASRRVLDCPGYIMQKLSEYTPNHREGRVFTMYPNTIYDTMRTVCEKNNIKFVGVHGLRHTNASVMLSLGIIDKVAMARGGWSTDYTMKNIYQHLFQSDKQSAGSKMDSFFAKIALGIDPTKQEKTPHLSNDLSNAG